MMKKNFKIIFLLLIAQNLFAQIDAKSWAYQLQDIDILQIAANTTFDLIVIDYSLDGTDENKFTADDILQIKNSNKKAIAYISIGEAENYRFYWQNDWDSDNTAPAWLGNQNPDWEGNYKVRFWDPDWQNIIFSYIDTIISQNFDGIYCDIVDAYYYWSEEIGEEPLADSMMIQFIANIRNYVDGKTQNRFYIIPQNGEHIIHEPNITEQLKEIYFSSIDAIGIEDVFFYGDSDENNSYNPDNDRLNVLSEFLQNNKTVFSIEYLTDSNLITTYIEKAKEKGFIPYASVRPLNILNDGIILSNDEPYDNLPKKFILYQNFPNPFGKATHWGNPSTTIRYSIFADNVKIALNAVSAKTTLMVYDITGQKVATLVNEEQSAGNYEITFDASSINRQISSGIYFYRLQIGNFAQTKEMLLIK